ncbi:MAG: exopolyphosphatase/guanosine-5'-triphosphate,3'-diphosphate pyrophosphatase [Pseudohongiellaceae bacterium]|jgi:exopolyphosphatase/guanosine-5'-triphosphate,3'-diphosphate pyrophosphatase
MYACIDLGSNSFHLLVGEWDNGKIRILERCSDKVQLGEDVRATGVISPAAFERGLTSLKHFKFLMDQYPLERYWALGTNSLRVTQNSQDFIDAGAAIGLEVSVISGEQEAVLIYAGVITELPEFAGNRLVIDIGGGSTEIIVGCGQQRLFTESMAIGCVAWRDRFFADDSADAAALNRQMQLGLAAAREVFGENAAGISKAGWDEAYASSGTVKMLANICAAAGYGSKRIDYEVLQLLRPQFIDCKASGSDLPGLKQRRRDLLLPGWCIMMGLMESYNIRSINFSPTALREGMLDFMVKNEKTLKSMEKSNLPKVSKL